VAGPYRRGGAGNLVPDSVFDHFVTADQMPGLEQVVYEGYLRGLRASGWDDDPRLVQLGMWSSADGRRLAAVRRRPDVPPG
jgi:hypothetical protein